MQHGHICDAHLPQQEEPDVDTIEDQQAGEEQPGLFHRMVNGVFSASGSVTLSRASWLP